MGNSCLINLNGDSITVKISINNGIRSSGKFYLGKPKTTSGYDIVEKFEAVTGDNGATEFTLATKSDKLLNYALAWSINACSQVPQVENGILKIEFWQNGEKCKTVTDTTYYGKYPQCSDGEQRSMKNQVIFIEKPQIQTEAIWASIE
ncbi:hypothetical protein [Ulvibacter antarcticus]|uniref:Uncharacterized protein n=1 Tax=Ulvibacter antarcticus TaxID=442714 RepID=A0A3L9Y7T4_9FLAO|nr:hypothetical protein [Ulvibacter antarcticus]RMA56786.1 hypothetical protein BXY75_3305 [Ulvibacter antarcticus]